VPNSLLRMDKNSTISASDLSVSTNDDMAINAPEASSPEVIENWLASLEAYCCNPNWVSNSFWACALASLNVMPLVVIK